MRLIFKIIGISYLMLNCICFNANAQEIPNILWARQHCIEGYWCSYKAMAITQNNELMTAVIASTPPGSSEPKTEKLFIWRINQQSEKVGEIEIKKTQVISADKAGITGSDIRGLTILENGNLLLIVNFIGNRPYLVKVSNVGELALTKDIFDSNRTVWISKVLRTKDGNHLLIGHESLDSLIVKIDSAGTILWEKKRDIGKMDLFLDGIATEDDGFVLIANSGDFNMLFQGTSNIWIGKYNADGEIETEKTFTGRYGSLTKASDGGYLIVYDKNTSDSQSIWFQSLDEKLNMLWESKVLDKKAGSLPSSFKTKTASNGNFIIAGGKEGKPYVTAFDQKRNRLWELWGESMDTAFDFDLLLSGNEFFISSTAITKNSQNKFTQKVNLIKVGLK